MKFSSIIRKNFTHNFNKYISFYFVNSLIIAMLFMYGSLMFNKSILDTIGETAFYETINISLMGLIVFSIVFITYTNISFLKNRGKEFGMYLTLGMTTKDLSKLIVVENLGVMIASLATGVMTGALLGRLFYMGLNKVLKFTNITYEINFKSFLLSTGIFILIFLCNVIFNIIYIKKVSIIDAIKSDKKKEVGKANVVLGIIALILFVVAMYCLPKTMFKEIFDGSTFVIALCVATIILSPYIIISSGIAVFKFIIAKFPRLYNKNILVVSNLSHRFLAYKNILYILSILLAGSMFYVGYSYSIYTASRESIELNNPYDIMFIETDEFNKVEEGKIEEVIKNNGSKLEAYNVLEYIEIAVFKDEGDRLTFWTDSKSIINESNYNKHMGINIDVKPNCAIDITVTNETLEYDNPNLILTSLTEKQYEAIQEISAENNYQLPKEDFNKIMGNSNLIEINKENIKEEKDVPFINYRYTLAGSTGNAIVLDDSDYNVVKSMINENNSKKAHLINLDNGDKAFCGLIDYLREKNSLDNFYWNNGNLWGISGYDERAKIEDFRPIYVEELVRLKIEDSGIIFFTMIFIGILFMIANGVVLYYKVLSDIDSEKERIISLNRIGITTKEIEKIINKELLITFFVPLLFGGGIGMYLLYIMVSNSGMTELLMKKSLLIFIGGFIIQSIFYLVSRRKYTKEMLAK